MPAVIPLPRESAPNVAARQAETLLLLRAERSAHQAKRGRSAEERLIADAFAPYSGMAAISAAATVLCVGLGRLKSPRLAEIQSEALSRRWRQKRRPLRRLRPGW
jgi:hypothetical protein